MEALRSRPPGTRTLVFTEYRDTALHLMRELRTRFRVIGVVGQEGWASGARIARREALDVFTPGTATDPLLEADTLVATDVASEGLNLQAASEVLNYDLPWNPVRVMQRAGRVDRLGSPHARVTIGHLVPGGGRRLLTTVLLRLRAKLDGMQRTISTEPDPLAALWWLDADTGVDLATEEEAERRVAAFESAERWRDHLGAEPSTPVVGAVLAADGGDPATGVLLRIVWDSGTRIPLAFVTGPGGRLTEDPLALGLLAERALQARPVPVDAARFVGPIATVLSAARARALEVGTARHVEPALTPERRAALRLLQRFVHTAARDRTPAQAVEHAAALLARPLTAGRERAVAAALRGGDAAVVVQRLVDALMGVGEPDDLGAHAPRLELVAALAVLTVCPSR
jgi:hypothetical protein